MKSAPGARAPLGRVGATLVAAVGAALVLVAVEWIRAGLASASPLGGFGFGLGVLGLLGLPAAVLGLALWGAADLTGAGWRWGRAAEADGRGAEGAGGLLDGVRGAAWALYGLLALSVLIFGVMRATMLFTTLFKRPVYQGLGAGLVAAGLVVVLVALAGPGVGLFRRGFARLRRRLPALIDPTRARGALVWVAVVLVGVAFVLPALRAELHTVDLRPARLGLLWAVLLFALRGLARHVPVSRGAARVSALAALVVLVGLGGAFAWSAARLGLSQSRKVALERDTLLAGGVLARLSRLGDADGDGVSRWFGGGDCDDHNPAIRPGVYDAPGDGVDQNCTGADLDLAADPLRYVERAPLASPEPADWHVVLVTIDALRHDTARAHMPRLTALAAESQDYRNAYSHGAATYWSLPALLQSTMPSRLHMGRDQTPVPQALLLPEVLQAHGWSTALFANVTVFFVRGLRQGMDHADYKTSDFTVHGAKPGSAHLTDGMLAHVDRFAAGKLRPARTRLFLWGHYYDPHDPYFEVPDFPAADGSDRARYEAIVRATDHHLGRLVDGLKARGLWDRTLLIVTADHGDEFLDHGHRFHGATLYEEMVHVPLIVRVPGLPGRVHTTPIGHLEVAPTLLDLLGIAAPDFKARGRSRAEELRTGVPAVAEPVFFEVFPDSNYAGHQVGLRLGDLKLIHRLHSNSFELYDLAADPAERHNRFDDHPEAANLRARLLTYVDHHLYWLGFNRSGAKLPPGTPDPPPRFVEPGPPPRPFQR